MKCEEIQKKLLKYKYKELPQYEYKQVEKHINQCSNCSKILNEDDILDNIILSNQQNVQLSKNFRMKLQNNLKSKPTKNYWISLVASVLFFFFSGLFMASFTFDYTTNSTDDSLLSDTTLYSSLEGVYDAN